MVSISTPRCFTILLSETGTFFSIIRCEIHRRPVEETAERMKYLLFGAAAKGTVGGEFEGERGGQSVRTGNENGRRNCFAYKLYHLILTLHFSRREIRVL